MTIWFVSRHPGALDWAARHGIGYERHVAHLDPEEVSPGDTVIGSLPVHLAGEVCACGARYFNLSLNLPANLHVLMNRQCFSKRSGQPSDVDSPFHFNLLR